MLLIQVFRLGNIVLVLLRANKIMEPCDSKNFPSSAPHHHTHNLVNSLLLVSDKKLKSGGDST